MRRVFAILAVGSASIATIGCSGSNPGSDEGDGTAVDGGGAGPVTGKDSGSGGSGGSDSGAKDGGGADSSGPTPDGGTTIPPVDGGAKTDGGLDSGVPDTGDTMSDAAVGKFSFFATSLKAVQRVSGSQDGFGGDLRFGQADGLAGADEICRQIAETSMPGAGQKTWRAFLSVTKGPAGTPINAIDRVGTGPWYDRLGRVLATTVANLAQTRPSGGDTAIINDFPNEDGVPNHAPDGTQVDNHDFLTGSDTTGKLYGTSWTSTCHDWTSSVGTDGKPRVGHSWPRQGSGESWMSSLDEAGCKAGVNIVEMGGPNPNDPTVGSGGGYGGFYCFALTP
jgi:hypothetical protein